MSTKPKPFDELQRKNRRVGDVIRGMVCCPLWPAWDRSDPTGERPLRVVAYRRNTVRLECPECGLRFSMDSTQLAETIDRRGGFVASMARVILERDQHP